MAGRELSLWCEAQGSARSHTMDWPWEMDSTYSGHSSPGTFPNTRKRTFPVGDEPTEANAKRTAGLDAWDQSEIVGASWTQLPEACLPHYLYPFENESTSHLSLWPSAQAAASGECLAPDEALRADGVILPPLPISSFGFQLERVPDVSNVPSSSRFNSPEGLLTTQNYQHHTSPNREDDRWRPDQWAQLMDQEIPNRGDSSDPPLILQSSVVDHQRLEYQDFVEDSGTGETPAFNDNDTPRPTPVTEGSSVVGIQGLHVGYRPPVKNESGSQAKPSPTWTDDEIECEVEYDTCFGVVIVEASVSTTDHREVADCPVTIRSDGEVLSVCFADSGRFAGIIASRGLKKLLDRHTVRVTAALCCEQPYDGKKTKISKKSGGSASKWRLEDAIARVVVYGRMEDKDDIANLLSDAGLFFQHPALDEYDSGVPYFNPHLLLRPGAEMPKVEELSISDSRRAATKGVLLDEVNQGRIWRIFDLASGAGTSAAAAASPRLRSTLRKHQLQALAMMIERECGVIEGAKFPSLWQGPSDPHKLSYRHIIAGTFEKKPRCVRGGVLADEMGLGKTLTTLALICWHLDVRDADVCAVDSRPSSTLIVVPKSTIIGWEAQIKRHINPDMIATVTYHGPSRKNLVSDLLEYDVVLTTYETLREDLMASKNPDVCTIYSHHWHRIVLDEAHRIRSRSSKLHQSALYISKRAYCHWCLTGTPIQNSLDDYGALLGFLQVPKLSDRRDFDRLIGKPVKDKPQYGLGRLRDLVRTTCLRRTISGLGAETLQLLPLEAKIEWIALGDDEELYTFFKRKTASVASGLGKRRTKGAKGAAGKVKCDENILSLINFLRLICNYGERMLPAKALEGWKQRDLSSLDWQAMEAMRRQCSRCGERVRDAADGNILPCGHHMCKRCQLYAEEVDEGDADETLACLACRDSNQIGEKKGTLGAPRSAKAQALIRNILNQQSTPQASPPQKCCWTRMLDLIQQDLRDVGLGVQQIDGQASLQQRRMAMEQFRCDPNCTVMLASIGSAGEGIDLISACHVHILEPQWNPMTESQAIGRVRRIGQTQQVSVTRYIVSRSIENVGTSQALDPAGSMPASPHSASRYFEESSDQPLKLKESLS
ncbi:hypothetical protein DL764_006103 [Monosporascus ibericus]|uniref:RING-type domain-containing protein n=1 Tax=Monosporascus ibericus TaxID=155417 RepID=A0A4Q4T5S5_9PEZI|nr:hypothetical protein DL764_006103 [Monosporascus ibericus]